MRQLRGLLRRLPTPVLAVLTIVFLALFVCSAVQGHLGRSVLIAGGTCLALVVVAARRPPG